MKGVGRPLKYHATLNKLKDDELYKPSTIADIPDWSHLSEEKRNRNRKRMRLALSRLAKASDFPLFGDGVLSQPGQPPAPAWYGWRWRNAANIMAGYQG